MRTNANGIKSINGVIIMLACLFAPVFVYAADSDNDGLSDEQEAIYHTDPANPDTDGDGYFDGIEVAHDYSPHLAGGKRLNEDDFDHDGLNDWLERWFGSDMGKSDTDGDGFSDYDEVMRGYSPASTTSTQVFVRKVVVDRSQQRLNFYVDGVKIHNFPASTGNPGTPTPDGEYHMMRKVAKKSYVGPGYDLPGVTWNVEFSPMYYIHTAYWHNDFGKRTHSHGCVNLREDDAKVIYEYIDETVPIVVTGETPAGYVVGT
ncbi:MAG: hypothetical protein CO030_01300 [Candidatus Magasanikbacteria bacterium CG_4_9_14_0_2_um_filter_42_11]|uniref:L,D-TPase catalytic domain-containing protein n=1 Tax=Candidatus Magasanikbacteria bacterium CG_4_9_14_0_2_um_filter_42_11 TaxID=1974643 RepID=A0A2M8FAI8_9BACT|nr:MAG: hypothetical protein COY70_00760 [Candidatus Magasanikbacteria bacterium CG_4_10_14_0_8_um_filter_42_12]PJC52753.1 MAG: hypothetical protein CO030_01300 [Candidatus Magasanikbacteria bacterium CG_4_9_14_0_2_um_filter_42_11]